MNWDEFFIAEANRVSEKSDDPSSKVGCVITAPTYTPIAYGTNRMPEGSSSYPWERPAKYPFVIHAEMDALLCKHRGNIPDGSQAFLTDAPCDACLKHLIHSGVKRIIYKSAAIMKRWKTDEQIAIIEKIIEASGAEVKNIDGTDLLVELML